MVDGRTGAALETRRERAESRAMITAGDVRGIKVRNRDEEDIGDIKDLVLNPETGCVAYAAVSYGGVLGLGEKLFAVPWRAMQLHPRERVFVADIDRRTLDDVSGFDKNHWPVEGDWDLIRSGRPTELPPEGYLPAGPAVQTVAPGWGGQPAKPSAEEERPAAESSLVTEARARPSEPVIQAEEKRPVAEAYPPREEMPAERLEPAYEQLTAADLQIYLKGVAYPAEKRDLIGRARENNAPPEVIEALGRFKDRYYLSAADVSVEYGVVR
jgi:sporulation protein YlmC with PRC-barrel domain